MLVKPRSRSRCAEGAGLEEHHQPNDNQRRSSAFSGVLISLLLSAISTMIKSKAGAPSYVRLTPQPTHIRSGLAHTKVPHALLRGRRAPRRMGPILALGISQPSPATVTHPPWIAVFSSCLLQSLKLSAPRQSGSRRFAGSATERPRACAPWRRSRCGAVGP